MAVTLPSHMRAMQWSTSTGGVDKNLSLNSSAPLPKNAKSLPKDHTLVKVAYMTPNPIDYKVADTVPFLLSKPASLGLDFSGVVVESKLAHLKTGELVFGKLEPFTPSGTLQDYIVVGKEGCIPLPPSVSLKDAACVGVVGLTAYQCIAPFVKEGNSVLINGGSGGTGTFGIQIAKALGCWVTTTCSGGNVEMCKGLGADEVIDYKSCDLVKKLTTSGKKFDLIVDNAFANPALYYASHNYLSPSGRYITIAGTPSLSFLYNVLTTFLWPGFLGGGKRKIQFVTTATNAAQYESIARWMEEGKVKSVIEEEFELERAGDAVRHLKRGRTKGKVVVKVAEEEPIRG